MSEPHRELAGDERLPLLQGTALDDPDLLARLDRLADLAAIICRTPIALVTLVEPDAQVFIGRAGVTGSGAPVEHSFCVHAIKGDGMLVVQDAISDDRFNRNPMVAGEPNIRFYAGQPLKTSGGEPLGSLCVIDSVARPDFGPQDVTAIATLAEAATALIEKWQAEHALQQAERHSRSRIAELEQRFNVLADSLPQLVWSARPDGYSDYFSRQWCEFTGAAEDVSFGTGWMQFLHGSDEDIAGRAWMGAVASGSDYEVRYRLRRHDGAYRWMLARGLPIHSESGAVVRWIGTCTDIHDAVESSEKLELLSQELTHRIKNIFAVIGGLVSLTARNNPEVAPLADELHGRILALGRAHDFVRPDLPADGAPLGKSSLHGMVQKLVEAYDTVHGQRIGFTGPDIAIDDRSATPLALFFHELATNSSKYGALSAAGGRVEIAFAASDAEVRLVWRDCDGPQLAAAHGAGFGSRLIEMSIGRQLGGKVEWDWNPAGLVVTAILPPSSLIRS